MKSTQESNFSEIIAERRQKNIGPMLFVEPLDRLGITLTNKLAIIGGFSACFKTTYGLNIVYNNAYKLGYNCCFLSLEMEANEILLRLLVIHANHPKFDKYNFIITINKVYKDELTEYEEDFLYKIVEPDFKKSIGKIIVLDSEDFSVLLEGYGIEYLKQKIDEKFVEISNRPLSLFVIDYVQLLARLVRKQYSNRGISDQFQVVSQLVRHLRYLTQKYSNTGLSVVILSQLNRASYSAVKERLRNPRIIESDRYKDIYDLTAISESSEIVNAADIVVTLYADEKTKKKHEAYIQLLKNRFGETIEEGIEVLVLPEFSYIGDFRSDDDYIDQDYIWNLIEGKLV